MKTDDPHRRLTTEDIDKVRHTVEVVWADELLHRAAVAFLQSRLDKRYSLCDAVYKADR